MSVSEQDKKTVAKAIAFSRVGPVRRDCNVAAVELGVLEDRILTALTNARAETWEAAIQEVAYARSRLFRKYSVSQTDMLNMVCEEIIPALKAAKDEGRS